MFCVGVVPVVIERHFGLRIGLSIITGGILCLTASAAIWYFVDRPVDLPRSADTLISTVSVAWFLVWLRLVFAPFLFGRLRLPLTPRIAPFAASIRGVLIFGVLGWVFGTASREGLFENKVWLSYVGTKISPFVVSGLVPTILIIHARFIAANLIRRLLVGRGAHAHWGGLFQALKMKLPMPMGQLPPTSGLVEGVTCPEQTWKPIPVQSKGQQNRMVVAKPGGGKAVVEGYSQIATQTDHIKIIVDPKGELGAMTGVTNSPSMMPEGFEGRTKVERYLPAGKSLFWNPFRIGPAQSVRFDPLDEIDLSSPLALLQLSAISHGCIRDSSPENSYWTEVARLIAEGTFVELKSGKYPAEVKTLHGASRLLSGLDPATGLPNPGAIDGFCERMLKNESRHADLCRRAAATFLELGRRERGIVFSDISRSFRWCSDPVYSEAFSRPTASIENIVESSTPITLYITIPMGAYVHDPRPVQMLIQLILRKIEARKNRTLPVHVMVDEAAQLLNGFTWLKRSVETLRGAGCQLTLILQYIRQLSEALGEEAADAFEASSDLVGLALGSLADAEYFSQRLGQRIQINRTRPWPFGRVVGRENVPLMSPYEIMQLLDKRTPYKLLIPSDGHPMLLRSLAFKDVTINQGTRYQGWPLKGAFDEELARSIAIETSNITPVASRINQSGGFTSSGRQSVGFRSSGSLTRQIHSSSKFKSKGG